jgi:class 3 adenylate cyclase/tetratricopeptide (TPR) repeat protein
MILTSRAALEGERKQVTVLFADVVGFSGLAERLDPETLHEVMDGCFAVLTEVVHRYEGTINQFTGDGIMALFGAPIAHEDHAVRALHAALDVQTAVQNYREVVQRRWQVPFQMRLGLNTGLVVVGRIGDDLRMDYTAQGDTVNLAARMQQHAVPGAIWVAEVTYRAAGEAFEWRPVGPIAVKGKSAEVAVYALSGRRQTRTRLPIMARRNLTDFTGRGPELQRLLAAWTDAETGQGRVVSVVGEAGLGKSRLLYEFKQQLGHREGRCVEGTCFTYGDSISYLPFLNVVRSVCGLVDSDTEPVAKERIDDRVATLGLDSAAVSPYLHNLLSFTVDDEHFQKLTGDLVRRRTVEALTALVLAEARRQPFGLILEDVHWIDKATEEVVEGLVEAMVDAPLLLILVYRPEYLQRWASRPYHSRIGLKGLVQSGRADMGRAALNKAYASKLSLEPLPPAQQVAMAQALLGGVAIPPEIEELIVTRTGGNPLFIEEMTRSLLESGAVTRGSGGYVVTEPVEALNLPTTVQGVLLARIDRLEAELKEVLQVAAVIGRLFSHPLLARVMRRESELEEQLLELAELEFIYRTADAPPLEYSFKHVLTQQAVYDALLRSRREALHGHIGHAIETLYPDRLDEYCELLAYHYARSTDADKAFVYLDQANRKAIRSVAMPEAKAYFDEAMRFLDRMPDTDLNRRRRIALLANQAPVMVLLFKFAECYELLSRYEPVGRALGDPGLLGAFYGCLGHCQWFFGELDRAITTLDQAARLSDAGSNPAAAAYAYMLLEWTHLLQGNFDRVFEAHDLAIDRLEEKFDLRTHTWARAAASMAYTFQGRWDEAIAESMREMRLAEEFSDNSNICFGAMMLTLNHAFKGDARAGLRFGELALQKTVTPADQAWAGGFNSLALCRAGEPRRAIEVLAPMVDMQRAAGFVAGDFFAVWLGEAYWRAGDLERANDTLSKAVATYERCGMQFFLGCAHRLLAEAHLSSASPRDEVHRVEVHLASSIDIFSKIHAQNELALAYTAYGRLFKRQGRLTEAREYLSRALELFERLGTLGETDEVRQEVAELANG